MTAEKGKAKESLKNFAEKKGIRKWFQRDNLIILVLSGVLLLIIALPTKEPGSAGKKSEPGQGTTAENVQNGSAAGENAQKLSGSAVYPGGSSDTSGSSAGTSFGDYASYLEQKLKQMLSGMAGVGRVNVMITLASSEELVVEKEEPVSRSNTTESDSGGGNRSIYQVESEVRTVYRTTGSDSEPYVVKTLLPEVEGVVVVAEGAGTGTVSRSITEVVQALFDLEANKIKVVKMEKAG